MDRATPTATQQLQTLAHKTAKGLQSGHLISSFWVAVAVAVAQLAVKVPRWLKPTEVAAALEQAAAALTATAAATKPLTQVAALAACLAAVAVLDSTAKAAKVVRQQVAVRQVMTSTPQVRSA